MEARSTISMDHIFSFFLFSVSVLFSVFGLFYFLSSGVKFFPFGPQPSPVLQAMLNVSSGVKVMLQDPIQIPTSNIIKRDVMIQTELLQENQMRLWSMVKHPEQLRGNLQEEEELSNLQHRLMSFVSPTVRRRLQHGLQSLKLIVKIVRPMIMILGAL